MDALSARNGKPFKVRFIDLTSVGTKVATADFASDGRGDFLSVPGDAELKSPLRAEVYIFPAHPWDTETSVWLTVEAKVTEDSCGQVINAKALQFHAAK